MAKLRIGTGNAYGGGLSNYTYKHNWKARLSVMEKLLRQMGCDVISFCELHKQDDADMQLFKRVDDLYHYVRLGASSGVMYNTKTVKRLDHDGDKLPDSNYKAFGWVLFQEIASGKKFYVSNTHLTANLGTDKRGLRKEQTEFILKKLKKLDQSLPHFLGGDFNDPSTNKSAPKGMLAAAGYYGLQKIDKPVNGDRDTNTGKKHSANSGPWIDDILVRNAKVSGSKAWPTGSKESGPEHEQTGASDHWAWISTDVELSTTVITAPEKPADEVEVIPLPHAVVVDAAVANTGPGNPSPEITRVQGKTSRFRFFARHPNGKRVEISTFRDVPVTLSSISTADPFGDSSAVVNFPQISYFDRPGEGDLWWLVPWFGLEVTHEELLFDSTDAFNTDGTWTPSNWCWEGNAVSEEIGPQHGIQFKGALYMADNFQAAPFYPQYPVPYEQLMTRALDPKTHPSLQTKPLKIQWPSDWNLTVPAFTEASYLWFLRPYGVKQGQKWSGLTTRSTGSWEPVLTGHIQTLLSTMYSPEGDQWTLMKARGRQPVLKVRNPKRFADETTLVVFTGQPGVEVSATRDFTQSANVIYGAGTDLAGSAFSGAQVSTDGETTYYEPFAALPQVYPYDSSNPRLVPGMVRKESRITFPQGIDELAAREIAATQIRRFADPGYTGTVTLDVDPFLDGAPFDRRLIQAGGTILIKNFRGSDMLFHVTTAEVSFETGTVSLSIDTKFRDALTVAEVKARTRDALDPVNLLQVGKQSVTVGDLLKPWSYSGGSGVIPSGGTSDATDLFAKMPPSVAFPWTDFTKKYPPSKFPQYYVKVSRKGNKASDRWQDNGYSSKSKRSIGVPIKASQAGSIRLIQVAAYDRTGTQVPVKFHFGIYTNSGITSDSMPMIPKAAKGLPYAAGDRYPFFPEAFEQNEPNGEEQDNPNVLLPEGADMVIAWGNVYDPAGYSPGLMSAGGTKTGRLVDETSWSFDTSSVPGFDKYSVANNDKNKTAGMLYAMIFCDDYPLGDLFFLGRMFIAPAGSN